MSGLRSSYLMRCNPRRLTPSMVLSDALQPPQVDSLEGKDIVHISCSAFNSIFLTGETSTSQYWTYDETQGRM